MRKYGTQINWQKNRFTLLADKALYWQEQHAVIVADVHLGKARSLQSCGISFPQGHCAEDLKRLETIVHETQAREVLILGDLFHSKKGTTTELAAMFLEFVEKLSSPVTLICGNHEKHQKNMMRALANEAKGEFQFSEKPQQRHAIWLGHEPNTPRPCLFGHIHPVVVLKSKTDRLRLACFHIGTDFISLPAFSSVAGGFEIKAKKDENVYVIADDRVIGV